MARKFRFRLQSLLRLREQAQQFRERRLADTVRQKESIEGELRGLAEQENSAVRDMHDAKTGALDMARLRWLNRHIGGLHLARRQREMDARALEGELARRREELVKATQEKKVVEKLKVRRQGEHQRVLAREEQAALDEAAQTQSRRAQDSDTEEPCTRQS
ncbi:MAG: flagellar export protein FliJ [Planctomycetes bacterium]|nr:flagellar export protein FliJ [Planctomycetota bacterium]